MNESKEQRRERQQIAEWQFVDVLRRAGNLVEPEHPVCKERKWRVDYLVNGERQFGHPVALEIQGWGFGHVGRAGWLRDIQKAQAIAANGWLYVPMTREDIKSGDGLEALAKCGVRVTADRGSTFPAEGSGEKGE